MSTNSPPLSAATTLTPGSPSSSPLPAPFKPDLQALKSSLPAALPTSTSSIGAEGTTIPTTASQVVEALASSLSEQVFVYDDSLLQGLGHLSLQLSSQKGSAQAWSMQARPGLGLSLLGRLGSASQGSSTPGGVLTAFVTPPGMALMSSTLPLLPPPSKENKLVVQLPAVSPLPGGALTPSLAALSTALAGLEPSSENLAVILSSTPAETATFAALSYQLPAHVVHVFDHHTSARELTSLPSPSLALPSSGLLGSSVAQALEQAGVQPFTYHGPPSPTRVLVALNTPLARSLQALLARSPELGLGLLVVKVLRPWDELVLLAALPKGVQELWVVDHITTPGEKGLLYSDVLGSLLGGADLEHVPSVHPIGLLPDQLSAYTSRPSALLSAHLPALSTAAPAAPKQQPKKLAFYSSPSSKLPEVLAELFLLSPSVSTRLVTEVDAFSHTGGVALHRLVLGRAPALSAAEEPMHLLFPPEEGAADFLALLDPNLLKTHHVLASAKPGAQVLVLAPWSAEELGASLPPRAREEVERKALRMVLFDLKGAEDALPPAQEGKEQEKLELVLQVLAFLRLYLAGAGGEGAVKQVVSAVWGESVSGVSLEAVCGAVWRHLREVGLPPQEAEVKDEEEGKEKPLKEFEFNTILPPSSSSSSGSLPAISSAPVPRVASWHAAAKLLLFREASLVPTSPDPLVQPSALRPETEDRTFLVTCTVNRRLTPLTYDRNVFHLEFDTSGTGLKYAIGEALGVHGWNDEAEVLDFCQWYGLDPDQVISVPLPSSETARGARHTRTVFQTLQQVVDLFGKPPKSFYAALSPLATDRAHSMALRFIASPEGAATFKKLSEVDTLTFADVLRMYPSARPGIEELVELVGTIKPRHYSIASSQSAVGDRVDLLVVTVDWVTPSGSPRYGQCTRYLAALKEGQKVTVSIKPSVMKLPPSDMQPIIMAGLGTGAAPFRAFMQHRAWQAAKGEKVGPLVYYFGSRHRSQEYLYGEEIEAYIRDGVIAHAGLAFSRDTNKKVYIQHKMQNDGHMLHKMLAGEDKGVFYLCGPTWPVPDVYEALVGSLVEYGGMERKEAEGYLEELKEDERYVLEVY